MNLPELRPIVVTAEMIDDPGPDLMAEIQARAVATFIEREITALAEVTSPEFARWAYTPTAFESYAFLGIGR